MKNFQNDEGCASPGFEIAVLVVLLLPKELIHVSRKTGCCQCDLRGCVCLRGAEGQEQGRWNYHLVLCQRAGEGYGEN